MNILIPMAGAGKRFSDAGYKIHKPLIPTTDLTNGKQYPMVVCAVRDIFKLCGEGKVFFVDRTDGDCCARSKILEYLPSSTFIGVNHLTEGQACSCLLAEKFIDNEESLFIGGCDNGMIANPDLFKERTKQADVLVFTYRHNDCVMKSPNSYGWVITEDDVHVKGVSVKKKISETPMEDHAIVASFWFRHGADFVRCTKDMIDKNDRINSEFYVDQVLKYCLLANLNVQIFEIERYLGWGTPSDYENYENTIHYWRSFIEKEPFLH